MADFLSEIGQLLGITKPAIAGPPSGGQQMMTPGAPGGPAPQPTAGQIFESPAVQGALNAYLGYLAAPRGEGWGRRVGIGGLEGLQGYEQAKTHQLFDPLQKAQVAAQTRALQPIAKEQMEKLTAYRAASKDPQERAYIDLLASQARGGGITNADLDKALEAFNAPKRQADLMKAQAAMQGSAMMPQLLGMAGFHVPSAAGAPGAAGGAPPTGPFNTKLPDGSSGTAQYFQDITTGAPKLFYLIGGKWTPAP